MEADTWYVPETPLQEALTLTWTGGLRVEGDFTSPNDTALKAYPDTTPANDPAGDIDDVLTYILLSIAISGSDFKSDCSKWWSKAVRLAITLRLNREDDQCSATVVPCADPVCSCHRRPIDESILGVERQEERRRVFWLLYSLDRHLSLSFNTVLSIPDSYCEVYGTWLDTAVVMIAMLTQDIRTPARSGVGESRHDRANRYACTYAWPPGTCYWL